MAAGGEALSDAAVAKLKASVQTEVDAEGARVRTLPRNQRCASHLCKFCPFRCFPRADRYLNHLAYHSEDRLFIANERSRAQWNLVEAIFEQEQVLAVLPTAESDGNRLANSAALIRQWNAPCADSSYLKRTNGVDLVLLLTMGGPTYSLKQYVGNATRFSNKVYYDNTFANLVFSLAVRHKGKIQTIFGDILSHFTAQGSKCAFLLPKRADTQSDIVKQIVTDPIVQMLREGLITTCTQKGEWEVITHDATFKSLMSCVGQEKMAQAPGEHHALHSFLGKSGAIPGLSAQADESRDSFATASTAVLPLSARSTTKWMFSDAPDHVELPSLVFPNLAGVGEDTLHFPFRLEKCNGEHVWPCSRRLRQIQQKFTVPVACGIYQGEFPADADVAVWPKRLTSRSAAVNWVAYVATPYDNHQQYVDDIYDLTLDFHGDMCRKDKKNNSALEILKNGSKYRHFKFMMNGCHIRSTLSTHDRELLGVGTTANEAIHHHVADFFRTVVQQHIENAMTKFDCFTLANLLAHNSAAYSKTLAQYRQTTILSILVGSVRSNLFKPFGEHIPEVISARADVRIPVQALNQDTKAMKMEVRKTKAVRWKRELAIKRAKRPHAFNKRAYQKRTVFTQKHEGKLKRKTLMKKPAGVTMKRPVMVFKRPCLNRKRPASSAL